MTCVLSAVFLSKYDFTGISSVLGSLWYWKTLKPFPIRCFPEGMHDETLIHNLNFCTSSAFIVINKDNDPQHHWQYSPKMLKFTFEIWIFRMVRKIYSLYAIHAIESVWLGTVLFFSITMIPSTLLMPVKSYFDIDSPADTWIKIGSMDWPLQSPDLNIKEAVWESPGQIK